ncbi:cyclin-like protein [Backusella circina FSU 941]|nr:cyclin-like protein [Backusella circina FSU 941]
MTNKNRKTKRNNSRQAALDFLTNIILGSENETDYFPPKAVSQNQSQRGNTQYGTLSILSKNNSHTGPSLDSSDTNSSTLNERIQLSIATNGLSTTADDNDDTPLLASPMLIHPTPAKPKRNRTRSRRPSALSDPKHVSNGSFESDIQQYELTREDTQRPIASEKIKKRSDSYEKDNASPSTAMSIMSVLRYYKGMMKQPKKEAFSHATKSYVHQHLSSLHAMDRKQLSYSHFLLPSDSLLHDDHLSYDPYYFSEVQNKTSKKEMNEQFRVSHPDIPPEVTFSKLISIKKSLLNVAKNCDLELSSLSHAYVYFEKLIQKHIVTKKNRRLIAACCLFLATKINEPKGAWSQRVYDAISAEFNISSKDIKENEFPVFADLEFNLYIPRREFMPHLERIFQILELEVVDYLGSEAFYEVDSAHEIALHA